MPGLTAKRTLVKSPPELWSELSEVERLARHLGAFGEIRITRLDPERAVAWEGEHASGTVSIEPSGWGTKVTLTAELTGAPADVPAAAGEAGVEAAEPGHSSPGGQARRGLWARLLGGRRPPEPAREEAAADPRAGGAPEEDPEGARAVLDGMLEALGTAHHRPFSRG